ncbi:hypothetical protein Tco_1119115 [Tanacetum coccineum]
MVNSLIPHALIASKRSQGMRVHLTIAMLAILWIMIGGSDVIQNQGLRCIHQRRLMIGRPGLIDGTRSFGLEASSSGYKYPHESHRKIH